MKQQNTKNWIGVIFIAIGTLWLLDNFDLFFFGIPFSRLIFSWHTFAIIIGAIIISRNSKSFWGYFWLGIGLISFVKHLHFLPFVSFLTFSNLWPIIIILIGTWMILNMNDKKVERKNFITNEQSQNNLNEKTQIFFNENILNENVQFTSIKKLITTDNFKGGKINVLFGSLVLDLTQCKLEQGENVLDISVMFGGVQMRVPQDWLINSSVSSTFGGYEDKRFFNQNATKTETSLLIKGTVAFGGCEISY